LILSQAELVWATDNIDELIAYMARVSNVNAKEDDPHERLIQYLIDHKHWSPFEMASICIDVWTTRDVGRQLLRHRSLHFQEFSQRYAEVDQVYPEITKPRLQDTKNRQNSLPTDDKGLAGKWDFDQNHVWDVSIKAYRNAIKNGIAKELARKLLPEGLTNTHMYVCGTVRDWFHYLSIRTGPETQLEHRELALQCLTVCREVAPAIFGRINVSQ